MKRVYRIDKLDCPACADKIERKVFKIKGIKEVNINYLMKKATIETDSADNEEIFDNAEKIIRLYAGDIEKE
ncbi:MAG: heavy metal-associated domain-containing protein [Clostridia bacterium]|jgi:copper chaperone CopZ